MIVQIRSDQIRSATSTAVFSEVAMCQGLNSYPQVMYNIG